MRTDGINCNISFFLCVHVVFTCFGVREDLDGGGGGGMGVKLVMRSLENRRHNGVMEGGSLPPSTPSQPQEK